MSTAAASALQRQPSFSTGFVRLLQALHAQLPTLLSASGSAELSLCVDDIQLRGDTPGSRSHDAATSVIVWWLESLYGAAIGSRPHPGHSPSPLDPPNRTGLLREPLLSRKERLGSALVAARDAFALLRREGAVSVSGDEPRVLYSLGVSTELDVTIAWELDAVVGGWAGRPSVLAVGLPLRLRGEVRLRLEPQSGLVQEAWVKSVAVNERPLIPGLLSRWVAAAESGPAAAVSVGSIMSALVPWLSGGSSRQG